jgi:hypothetical protein
MALPFGMELLLNIAWLLLALPAYWLWRGSRTASAKKHFSALQVLLALGCALVILFPVISATDDLHAMRSEMEESPASKRSIRQAGSDKASLWTIRLHAPPALVEGAATFAPAVERSRVQLNPNSFLPTEPTVLRAGRAPPQSHLA